MVPSKGHLLICHFFCSFVQDNVTSHASVSVAINSLTSKPVHVASSTPGEPRETI